MSQTTVGIRMTTDHREAFREAADKANLPLSEWARRALCRAAGLPDPPQPKPGWPLGRCRKLAATVDDPISA